jgi:hypothetical protein
MIFGGHACRLYSSFPKIIRHRRAPQRVISDAVKRDVSTEEYLLVLGENDDEPAISSKRLFNATFCAGQHHMVWSTPRDSEILQLAAGHLKATGESSRMAGCKC